MHPEEKNMKENEHRLIKDLYSHYKPDTVVDDELITNCYKQYGSIRGVLMNLIFKFDPNSEVNDAYIDAKLKAYGIIIDVQKVDETENSSVLVDENKQVKEPQIQKKESLSSVSDNKEIKQSVRPEETKNESKNQWLRYLILIIIGVSLGIGSFIVYQNYSSSNAVAEVIEEEVIINYHYVISSKLHLCEAPGEKSIQLLEMPFGTPVELLGDETKIEEYTYQRARVNGTNGWVSTKKHEILLINSADKLSEIHDIINGPGDQQVLESMPSYAKYTLLEIEKTANYRGVQVKIDDTDGYSEIKFFRSKEANRNSSSDKRKGINNGLKDMAVIVTYPDYSNSVLFVSFSKTYKWNIVLEVPIEDYSVIGLEILKRRSSIQSQGLEIVNSIKFDAIAIRTDNGTDKYIYGAEGRLEEVLPPSYSQQFYKIEDPDGWSNLRDSPNGEILQRIYDYELFEVIGEENDYKNVKLEDGTEGYVHESRVVMVSIPGVYPQASTRYLSDVDLKNLSNKELKIMRNEIFARYGRKFNSESMYNYFNAQSWYTPIYEDVNDMLTVIEKHNVKMIKQYE